MFDKSKIGQSFPPFTVRVERCKVYELALAIGDTNPIYHDLAAAQAAGYADVPLPPTFPTVLNFWGNTLMWQQLAETGIQIAQVLHGEEAYEYLAPIVANDVLTGVMSIVDGKSRPSMDIVTVETRYTNQRNESVLNVKTMFIVRE
ncbi:FAS1-like dehydratase domain-containing protein [Dictyobacter arantiisoli]|uniref:Dehydratase n=1 Tax=Dictyobacter arantiisoli TaxID=2014874 RepID=A0A5A5T648_9CHLR|nr:MaoC family dehydratase N-terminal domain-containing protein [Dictyobacter arantiisoli]GCF06837.1 dehydratase [Dictyobacter arantiisoli]